MIDREVHRLGETSAANSYDANEAFAEALRGERQDTVVCENSEFLAFVDSCPHAREHVAVIAKSPITRLAVDEDSEIVGRLSILTSELVEAVCETWNASSVIVTEHNDLVPYPTVARLHVLILPVKADRPDKADAFHVSKTHLGMLAQKLATAVA